MTLKKIFLLSILFLCLTTSCFGPNTNAKIKTVINYVKSINELEPSYAQIHSSSTNFNFSLNKVSFLVDTNNPQHKIYIIKDDGDFVELPSDQINSLIEKLQDRYRTRKKEYTQRNRRLAKEVIKNI